MEKIPTCDICNADVHRVSYANFLRSTKDENSSKIIPSNFSYTYKQNHSKKIIILKLWNQ